MIQDGLDGSRHSLKAATGSPTSAWPSSSFFSEQHSPPSEQQAFASSPHGFSPLQHPPASSALQLLASPEQHWLPSEQHLLSADAVAQGQPPAEQSSSPSLARDASVASGEQQPATSALLSRAQHPVPALASELFISSAGAFEQQEPHEEVAEKPPTALSVSTPFLARRIPAAIARTKAKATGNRARIMLAPRLKIERFLFLSPPRHTVCRGFQSASLGKLQELS